MIKNKKLNKVMTELFRRSPHFALEMLTRDLEEDEQGAFLITLRQMTKTHGGVQDVAEKANLNPTQLYRTLSEHGNPELRNLTAILKVMGLRLTVRRMDDLWD